MARTRRKITPPQSRPRNVPQVAMRPDGRRLATVVVCGLLTVLVAVAFLPALGHGFLRFDDDIYVWREPHVKSGFTAENWNWAWTHSHAANWHPLTTLSHIVDCHLFGLRAWGHHLVNLMLQALAAILVFLVTKRMTGRFWACAALAAVFAVHPLRVESVVWIAERKDLLCAVFFWLTVAAYVRYARLPFSMLRYGLVVACFALALLAKPMAVSLPLVLLLLDYWPLGRMNVSGTLRVPLAGGTRSVPDTFRLLLEKLPLLALSVASSIITLIVQREAVKLNASIPFAERAINTLMSYQAYLRQTFWPVGLAGHYPLPRQVASLPAICGAAALLLAVTAVVIALRRTWPYLLVGWLWYLGMLIPVIGLVQVGRQAMADRYTYLPQLGLLLMFVFAAADYLTSRPWLRPLTSLVVTLLLALMAAVTWRQTQFWRDDFTFMQRALDCREDDSEMHNNMAAALIGERNFAAALPHARRAVELDPDSATAHANLANILMQRSQFAAAREHAERCVQLSPDEAEFRFLYGSILALNRRYAEAVPQFQEAIRLRPDQTAYRDQLQRILAILKQIDSRRAIKNYLDEKP
jgi:protein O-mannosyl-transferase